MGAGNGHLSGGTRALAFLGTFSLLTLLILIFLFALHIDLAAGAVSLLGIESTTRRVWSIQKFVNVSYSWVSIALYVWGTFLAVFASSGLFRSVLEPGRISLLLAKPVGRTTLLLGRYLGNLLVVALNHIYLVGGVWLILGWKTNIWEARFLLAIPISIFIFAVLLCVVVFVGVWTESSAVSVMVPVALALLSALLAQHELVVKLLDSEWSRKLWMLFYWILPKCGIWGIRCGDLYLPTLVPIGLHRSGRRRFSASWFLRAPSICFGKEIIDERFDNVSGCGRDIDRVAARRLQPRGRERRFSGSRIPIVYSARYSGNDLLSTGPAEGDPALPTSSAGI